MNQASTIYPDQEKNQVINLDDIKVAFWHFWSVIIGCKLKELKIHPENVTVVRHLIYWALNDGVNSEYDTKKGLFFYGFAGSGKTDLVKSLSLFLMYLKKHINQNGQRPFLFKDYSEMRINADNARSLVFLRGNKSKSMVFDDLGVDETPATKFIQLKGTSTKRVLVMELVRIRHKQLKYKRVQTHFTANHRIEDIERIYGSRTSTRILEMCNIIHWHGENLRK